MCGNVGFFFSWQVPFIIPPLPLSETGCITREDRSCGPAWLCPGNTDSWINRNDFLGAVHTNHVYTILLVYVLWASLDPCTPSVINRLLQRSPLIKMNLQLIKTLAEVIRASLSCWWCTIFGRENLPRLLVGKKDLHNLQPFIAERQPYRTRHYKRCGLSWSSRGRGTHSEGWGGDSGKMSCRHFWCWKPNVVVFDVKHKSLLDCKFSSAGPS